MRVLYLLQMVKLLSYIPLPIENHPEIYGLSFLSLTPCYDAIFSYGLNWLVWSNVRRTENKTTDISHWRKMLVLTPLQNLLKITFLWGLFYWRHYKIKQRDKKKLNEQVSQVKDEFFSELGLNSEEGSVKSDSSFKLAKSRRSDNTKKLKLEKAKVKNNIKKDQIPQIAIQTKSETYSNPYLDRSLKLTQPYAKEDGIQNTHSMLHFYLNNPEFDRAFFRIITIEIMDSIISTFKMWGTFWERSHAILKVFNVTSLLLLFMALFLVLTIFVKIFFYHGKDRTLQQYISNQPTCPKTVFRFEIEQKIDKKLKQIEIKKKLSFYYKKPLDKIDENVVCEEDEFESSEESSVEDKQQGVELAGALEEGDDKSYQVQNKIEILKEDSVGNQERMLRGEKIHEGDLGLKKIFKNCYGWSKGLEKFENQSTNSSNNEKQQVLNLSPKNKGKRMKSRSN